MVNTIRKHYPQKLTAAQLENFDVDVNKAIRIECNMQYTVQSTISIKQTDRRIVDFCFHCSIVSMYRMNTLSNIGFLPFYPRPKKKKEEKM